MPTVFQQLAAHREISALRNVLDCSLDASVLREGAGTGPAWLMFLCPAYSEEAPRMARCRDAHGQWLDVVRHRAGLPVDVPEPSF